MKLKIIFIAIAFLITTISYAQQVRNIDSLENIINTTTNDSIKLRLINQVAFYYIFNDIQKSIEMINPGLDEAYEKEMWFSYNELTNTKGNYFNVKGVKDSAKIYYEKSLILSRKHNFVSIEQLSLNSLGLYYWSSGAFETALEHFYKALDINKRFTPENEENRANYLSNIGLIYQELRQYDKAIEHHKQALEIREKLNLETALAISNANLGVCYKNLNDYQTSIYHYNQGIAYAKSANNLRLYHAFHDNLANVYLELEDYPRAIELYKKSLDRPATVGGNPKSDLSSYSNLVAAYKTINQPREALNYAQKGFDILENDPSLKNFAATLYKNAAESHYMLGDINKGSEMLAGYIAINDSIFTKNNAEALANFEVQFQTQEKELQLVQTRASLAEKELKIGRKNMLIYGITAMALVLIVLGYLLYNQQKLKNTQLQKEAELKEALNQIAIQNQLQEQRLRISRDLHDNIGAQLTFIISSIENLKYSLKSENGQMNQRLNNITSFTTNTIFELRDTIWAMNKPEITIEDLKLRIINFIDKAREIAASVNFEFKVDKQLSDEQAFSSIMGMNLYRIIQEAVHNALKYAEAKNIEVNINLKGENLKLSIKDDGKGFDQNNTEPGNGLNNMKKRAVDLKGKISINTETEKGTNIKVVLPANLAVETKEAS